MGSLELGLHLVTYILRQLSRMVNVAKATIPDYLRFVFSLCLLIFSGVVIIAQLMPQIVASLYPTQFLELIVMRPVYWACICLETSGITHICWVLAWLMGKMFGMKEEVVDDGVEMAKHGNKDNHGYAPEVA